MIEDALRFPLKGDRSIRRLLAGGMLLSIPFPVLFVGMLISPALLAVGVVLSALGTVVLYGYLVAVLRESVPADPTPPQFSGWGTLLGEGVLAIVIWLVYLLPVLVPGVVYAAWLYVSGTTSLDNGPTAAALFLAALAATVMMVVVSYYFAPAALANYVHGKRVRAAFDVRTVVATATTKEYAVAWGLATGIYLTIGLIAGVLQFLLVGFFLYFYMIVVMTYLCGRGYADAIAANGPSEGRPSPTVDTVASDG